MTGGSPVRIKRALVSVSDKSGIVELGRFLVGRGAEVVSSGGTARTLMKAGVEVTTVEEVTGAPEMLGGRVKTLHPLIHGGILADPENAVHREDLTRFGVGPFQMVVCNLYPFGDAPGVEQIDIGGVALLRAAAKNYAHVTTVSSPGQYPEVMSALESGTLDLEMRRSLAAEAFAHTASYDAAIARWLSPPETLPSRMVVSLRRERITRYGENPHQEGALYSPDQGGFWGAEVRLVQGKAMSYNNYADAEAAVGLVADLDGPACVIVKHANPCGVGTGAGPAEAFARAWEGDPMSAFGGVVAFNRALDESVAGALTRVFIEVVSAPKVTAGAAGVLSDKPDLRVLETPTGGGARLRMRSLGPDFLVQSAEQVAAVPEGWRVVSKAQPGKRQLSDLRLAWVVAAHTKSNAVAICRDGRAVGVGAGDQSRVGAALRAVATAGDRTRGAVAASDGFFPFRDGVDTLASVGVTAVISPGGSVRDAEVIEAANDHGLALVFTGRRHFRH